MAFDKFWNQFLNRSAYPNKPIRAFQEGYAVDMIQGRPQAPPFPYITYSITRPTFTGTAMATGKIWNQISGSPAAFGLVDDILAQAAEAIPESGIILDLGDDGAISFSRSNPFIQYLPTDDQTMVAGIITVIVKNYVL